MRRETKLLLDKASDSLLLAIEIFNRPQDRGRVTGALIHIDHAFEMLLKAAIVHRGGSIRDQDAAVTIGFDTCVRRGLSNGAIKFLSEEQALCLQTINGLRDATQHYLLDISEQQLYIHIQSGVTLFRDLLRQVFGQELSALLPNRVLPVSTSAPTDLATVFDHEVAEVLRLLDPNKRRRLEAEAKLRALTVLDSTIQGESGQPSPRELRRIGRELSKKPWQDVFPGVALVDIVSDGTGPSLAIRLTKTQGPPVQINQDGTPGALPVAVRRVNELDFYNLGAKSLAEKLGLTQPKVLAVVEHLALRDNPDCFKEFKMGKVPFKRYSQRALQKIEECLASEDLEQIWTNRSKSGHKKKPELKLPSKAVESLS